MSKQNRRPKGWLIKHVLSLFAYEFEYNSRDFWCGSDELWSKIGWVDFRFLKIFLVEWLALVSKFLLFLLLCLYGDLTHDGGWHVATYTLIALSLVSLFFSFVTYGDVMEWDKESKK